jgi:chaperone BCS1
MTWTALLAKNQFLSGGLVLGGLAACGAIGLRYLALATAYLSRRFVAEIEVREGDMVGWLGLWLAHTEYGLSCRRIGVQLRWNENGGMEPVAYFEPGVGPHLFRHRGVLVYVDRRRTDEKPGVVVREWFIVRSFGPRHRLTELLEEAKTYSRDLLSRRHTAYMSDGRGGWDSLGVGVPRLLESVILPGDTVADVLARIKNFLSRRAWYAERGVPWRLSFGLFGPPRTGKTSLVRAIAHEMGLPLYVLDMTSKEFADRDLIVSLSRLPQGAVVLIEDIDSQLGAKASAVTLSGLLNALDGPLASEGRILFMTSNTPEQLDAALVGEGRVDVRVTFGYATSEQVRGMWLRFFPGDVDGADDFADALPDGVLPPATIQEHLVARSDNPSLALAEAHLLTRREVRIVSRGGQ